MITFGGLTIVCMVGILAIVVADNAAWNSYRASHECRMTGKTRESTSYIKIGDMLSPIVTEYYEWRCDGSEDDIHWRTEHN